MTEDKEPKEEQKGEVPPTAPQCYSKYNDGQLDFDPLKELNLPANYDEVLERFNRLQGDRAMEALN